jgi:hypothetical protein
VGAVDVPRTIHPTEFQTKLQQFKGACMATNTTVLLIVAAMAVLVLAGVLAGVVYQTRAPKWGELARDQVEEDAIRLRRQELLVDEFDAKAHAARVEVDIKTVRATSAHDPIAARMATPNSRLTGKHLRQKRFH